MIVFGLTAAYVIVEVVAGLMFGSLALLSDGGPRGHRRAGAWLAPRRHPARPLCREQQHTYGTYRLEVLAAVVNGLLLFSVGGYVLYERPAGWSRPAKPPSPGDAVRPGP